ncbi:MAG: hypothetical protein GWM98_03440, partial [Nitrospinaceae bacterium]|nr:hypothetical protein [Nitrospinaceae bacterium]NIR53735.1 hypothetical protein [Nitrospinaceae bacterium]NIS84143.1 hypothetical protein [Nitrospinaceae bacterium]NIT80944.1 hypothetical protein [Nitrospinaceae bacterium]NIU43242.1 hypothetical protein [Nitrospinaceae bacterium]
PTSTFLPGDVAEITPQGTRIHRQGSDFVQMREDDSEEVEFKPVAEVPPIRTLTQEEALRQEEMKDIRKFMENEFLNRVLDHPMMEVW